MELKYHCIIPGNATLERFDLAGHLASKADSINNHHKLLQWDSFRNAAKSAVRPLIRSATQTLILVVTAMHTDGQFHPSMDNPASLLY